MTASINICVSLDLISPHLLPINSQKPNKWRYFLVTLMLWPTSRKSIIHQILKQQIRTARFESRQPSVNFSFMNSFPFEFSPSSVNYQVIPL